MEIKEFYNIDKLNEFLKNKDIKIQFKIEERVIKAPRNEIILALKEIQKEIEKYPSTLSPNQIIILCDISERLNFELNRRLL